MKKEPIVSVVIPTYNHRQYVISALESVWAQTFTDYEVIVVNDGSPDDTDDVLRPYVGSGRIDQYYLQVNTGQGATRNRGLLMSRGKYIAFLDDDDTFPPDKLSWQVQFLEENPDVGVVYGFPQPVDDTGAAIEPSDAYHSLVGWPWDAPSGNIYRQLTRQSPIISPGQTLIRRDAMATFASSFDPDIRGCDDWDLWLRIAETWRFHFEGRVALHYRLHATNASKDTLSMRKNDFRMLHKHLRRNLFRPARFGLILYRYMAFIRWTPAMMIEQAAKDIESGKVEEARAKLRYAASFRPFLWYLPAFRSLWERSDKSPYQGH